MMKVQSSHSIVCLIFHSLLVAVTRADLLSSQLSFTNDLTNLLHANVEENQCSSSLGVSMMFSLLYPSMAGNSKSQTEALLGFSDTDSNLAWSEALGYFAANYSGACLDEFNGNCFREQPIVSVSNSVWIHSGSTLSEDYQETLGDDLIFETDFSAADAGSQVNAWVETATRNLIDSIVDDGPLSPTVLLAVNAIYLKANWQDAFNEMHTTTDRFYTPDKLTTTREEAIFMHQVEFLPYTTTLPGFQMVQLPFSAGSLSMLVVLPTTRAGGIVTASQALDAIPQLQRTRVALALPKFEFDTTYADSLKSSLMDVGLTAPFMGDLCIYQDDCSPFLSVVVQKTYISVDEKGVEAAAVTAGLVATSFPTGVPVEFLANVPFQFFLYDAGTGVVLFEGRVVDPIPHQGVTAEVSNHQNSTLFWMEKFFVEPEIVFDFDSTTAPVPVTAAPVVTPATTTSAPVVSPATSTSAPVVATTTAPVVSPSTGSPVDVPSIIPQSSARNSCTVFLMAILLVSSLLLV